MKKVTLEMFKTTTANEYGEAFGLIDLVPGTTTYELVTDDYTFAIGFCDGEWACQIDDAEGGCAGCWQGATPELALENAAVDACSSIALRENDNCEDAVNQMAYSAYGMLNDCEFPDTDKEYVQLDRLMAMATVIVKQRGSAFGIEWEPYQVCES